MYGKPRWEYKFDNYKRAFNLLRDAMSIRNERVLSDLEEEGLIQRFEYTWELAWKTLKDYLENNGLVLSKITDKKSQHTFSFLLTLNAVVSISNNLIAPKNLTALILKPDKRLSVLILHSFRQLLHL